MTNAQEISFPGESAAYRSARGVLLEAERALRRQVEEVAAMRRALPPGGLLQENYQLQLAAPRGCESTVHLSDLFADGKDTLLVYGFMFTGGDNAPCPMCSAFLDSFDGAARHLQQRINVAVIAKATPAELSDWAASRGWQNLNLLSSGGTTFNRDYLAETDAGDQLPMVNVFQKSGDDIRHTYASELFFAGAEPGQNPRHVDLMWPLWQALDLTPGGRGDWYPPLDAAA